METGNPTPRKKAKKTHPEIEDVDTKSHHHFFGSWRDTSSSSIIFGIYVRFPGCNKKSMVINNHR